MVDVSSIVADLESDIPRLMRQQDLPGLAVGVCDDTDILWSKGFGTTRAGGRARIKATTMFSVQSCSKMYAATATMLAVQDGLIDLDRPITDYLPEFTVHSSFERDPQCRITIRHLLSHTAGFTHEAPVGSNYLVGTGTFSQHCASISDTWLRFPVGHHYEYSNLGIDLAGFILQRVSGLPFVEYVRRGLLVPLGLRRTTFDHRVVAGDTDRAVGHDRQLRLPLRIPMVPAGGLYASVTDACRYLQFHLRGGESLLDRRLLASMYRVPFHEPRPTLGYGLGIVTNRLAGAVVRGHTGGGFGFLSHMSWQQRRNLGIVVLTNSVHNDLSGVLAERIARALGAGTRSRPPRLLSPVPASGKQLRRVSGSYVGRGYGVATVTGDGDRLAVARGDARSSARLTAADEIMIEDGDRGRFIFRGGDAEAQYMQSMDDGFVHYRNDPLTLPPFVESTVAGPWNHEYVLRASGRRVAAVRLRKTGAITALELVGGPTLRLSRIGRSRYLCTDGEMLDLTRKPSTFANIRLE